jgi:hypothetical protein
MSGEMTGSCARAGRRRSRTACGGRAAPGWWTTCELAGPRVVVGDRAAGLHRRRVRARVDDVLLTTTSARANTRSVAALSPASQSKMWLSRWPSLVVADQRGVGIQRLADVDDGGQRLVLDVDQLERVTRGVAVLGDDERDLLALEADLVGGEHRLRRRRGSASRPAPSPRASPPSPPGEPSGGPRPAKCRRTRCARAREAPEDGQMQHAGQLEIIDVPALAAHEARILLAKHPPMPCGFCRRTRCA